MTGGTAPWEILACPACGSPLAPDGEAARCGGCGTTYTRAGADGPLDLRLQAPREVTVNVELGAPPPAMPPVTLDPNPTPPLDLTGVELPNTISRRFASFLAPAPRPGARVLDLGCGDTRARPLLEHAGYEYVGLDYEVPDGNVLGDAHALPFADGSFDLITSNAVLEFFRYPYRAGEEMFRVLAPGGTFLGNAGFLVPYIPVTYFNYTHMGLLSVLDHAGFDVKLLMADRGWTALEAVGTMSLLPRMPDRLVRLLFAPIKGLHLLWWRLGARRAGRPLDDTERVLRVAGHIEALAVKPSAGQA